MALGIAGTSVLASSGDKGAHEGCEYSAINSQGGCGTWVTSYPAVSAYVTAVGGSEFVPAEGVVFGQPGCLTFGGVDTPFQSTTCVQEAAISIGIAGGITSGGGFANTSVEHYAPLPTWQANAVQAYLNIPGATGYASSTGRGVTPAAASLGRGYPDISGFAGNIGVVTGGVKVRISSFSNL
jgi:subtilase family serine protease